MNPSVPSRIGVPIGVLIVRLDNYTVRKRYMFLLASYLTIDISACTLLNTTEYGLIRKGLPV